MKMFQDDTFAMTYIEVTIRLPEPEAGIWPSLLCHCTEPYTAFLNLSIDTGAS